jgi:pimeloyl-ACP methyl ester carboxylesterase
MPPLPARWRVFALDQRGFGESEKPASGYGVEDFAADVAAFLDALSIERVTLVGHSFGSFVARRVAESYPQRVARLALIGTGWTARNAVTREVQSSIAGLPDPVPLDFAREFQSSTVYLPPDPRFFERMLGESRKLPAPLWREVFDRLLANDDTGRLAAVAAPTVLLWGDHDAIFPREDQDRVVKRIPGARLEVYPETGHCPNWERPGLVADSLSRFLGAS